ncbi:MAG: 3'-5' exonuclease [Euryarchaeota archaeon]|nr:3'-5' exonuclease [Euryarchaeota archaeon]
MQLDEIFEQRNFVVLDLETTGLKAGEDVPIEVGLLFVIDWVPGQLVSWIINPNYPEQFNIPEEIRALTGITQEQVMSGADPKVFYPALASLLQGMDIWGHNISMFDKNFLDSEFRRTCVVPFKNDQYYDTAAIVKAAQIDMMKDLPNAETFYEWSIKVLGTPRKGVYYNLPYSCESYGVDTTGLRWHTAGNDVLATFRLISKIKDAWVANEL